MVEWIRDSIGRLTVLPTKQTITMLRPVLCNHCGRIYDLAAVEVVARYADCTMYKTPCCKREADDRSGKSLPDFYEVSNG